MGSVSPDTTGTTCSPVAGGGGGGPVSVSDDPHAASAASDRHRTRWRYGERRCGRLVEQRTLMATLPIVLRTTDISIEQSSHHSRAGPDQIQSNDQQVMYP